MRFDLDFLADYSRVIGFPAFRSEPDMLEVFVGDDAILLFQNAPLDEDCLLGFDDTHGTYTTISASAATTVKSRWICWDFLTDSSAGPC